MDKLIKPFERLRSPNGFPGHGIGLATGNRIVRRHGGKIRAESAVGSGATFRFRFRLEMLKDKMAKANDVLTHYVCPHILVLKTH